MKGKIVLVPFPFTDLKTSKRRPALVILEKLNDVVVVFISSKIPKVQENQHIIVKENDKDFQITGLKVSSTFYLDKIATLSKNLLIGELGQITKEIKRKFNKNIKRIYHF